MTAPLDFDSTRLPSPHLTDAHEAWRRSVRAFVDREIMPNVNAWDEAGGFPRELHRKAAEVGLLSVGYPEEFGGVREGVDLLLLPGARRRGR